MVLYNLLYKFVYIIPEALCGQSIVGDEMHVCVIWGLGYLRACGIFEGHSISYIHAIVFLEIFQGFLVVPGDFSFCHEIFGCSTWNWVQALDPIPFHEN